MRPEASIVFLSPAGSTRHVATVIERELNRLGTAVATLDLKNLKAWHDFRLRINAAAGNACVFVGSPVYRGMAVPPVMAFIDSLSPEKETFAAPFVTWGGASSGIALWQMGAALQRRGFKLAAAASVQGFHSLMYSAKDPLGRGRPNARDDQIIRQMTAGIHYELENRAICAINPETLDYQIEAVSSKNKNNLNQPWKITPRIIEQAVCTRCGLCAEQCPTGAIALSPYPQFGADCIDCLNCFRLCPENAIVVQQDLARRVEQIKKRATVRNEMPQTRTFMGRSGL